MSSSVGAQDTNLEKLCTDAMRGKWSEVFETCKQNSVLYTAKITGTGDTVLHMAVSNGQEKLVANMLDFLVLEENNLTQNNVVIPVDRDEVESWSVNIVLGAENDRKNTPLHLAAVKGNVEMCKKIGGRDPSLIARRNVAGETPLFLASVSGRKEAFLWLHYLYMEGPGVSSIDLAYCIRDDNDTILHCAIAEGHFDVAIEIVHLYKDHLTEMIKCNKEGLSPLHLLAAKPSAFKTTALLERSFLVHSIYWSLKFEKKNQAMTHEDLQNSKNEENSLVKHIKYWLRCFLPQVPLLLLLVVFFAPDERPKLLSLVLLTSFFHSALGTWLHEMRKEKEKLTWSLQIMNKLLYHCSDEENQVNSLVKHIKYWFIRCLLPLFLLFLLFSFFEPAGDMPLFLLLVQPWSIFHSENQVNSLVKHIKYWFIRCLLPLFLLFLLFSFFEPAEGDIGPLLFILALRSLFIPSAINFRNWLHGIRKMKEKHVWSLQILEILLQQHASNEGESVTTLWMPFQPPSTSTETIEYNEVGSKIVDPPLMIAAKNGVIEMVKKILQFFPSGLNVLDNEGKNIVLLAVEKRQTKLHQFLFRHHDHNRAFRQVDKDGNTALHLAAKAGINLYGQTTTMIEEFKWFQFVKSSVPSELWERYNKEGKTAEEIFRDSYKEHMTNDRKWLDQTSQTCSVASTLVASMAFSNFAGENIKKKNDSSLVALSLSLTSTISFLAILAFRSQSLNFWKHVPFMLHFAILTMFSSIVALWISLMFHGHSRTTCAILGFPMAILTFVSLPIFIGPTVMSMFNLVPPPNRNTTSAIQYQRPQKKENGVYKDQKPTLNPKFRANDPIQDTTGSPTTRSKGKRMKEALQVLISDMLEMEAQLKDS